MTGSVFLRASLLAVFSFATPAPPPSAAVLPFIEDNYPRALAEARSKRLPIFVEAWAPW